jgi:hypothetical protein
MVASAVATTFPRSGLTTRIDRCYDKLALPNALRPQSRHCLAFIRFAGAAIRMR